MTSHEAGLAVPDWPLSYGQLFPPMVGNIFWEHGHRMIAGFVGVLTLIFALCAARMDSRRWFRRLAWTALLMVVAQAILGGLTVKLLLPPAISIFHACLAQTFFTVTVALAYFSGSHYQNTDTRREAWKTNFAHNALVMFGFIYLQLLLGAIVRHTSEGIVYHVINGVMVLLMQMNVLSSIMKQSFGTAEKRLACLIAALTVGQFFAGIGAYIYTHQLERGYAPRLAEVILTSFHHSNGALILALSFLLYLVIKRTSCRLP